MPLPLLTAFLLVNDCSDKPSYDQSRPASWDAVRRGGELSAAFDAIAPADAGNVVSMKPPLQNREHDFAREFRIDRPAAANGKPESL